MAEERDNTPVIVQLDQQRQYRNRETMQVITVGPGKATVPRNVADRWGLDSKRAEPNEPITGYGALGAREAVEALEGLDSSQRAAVRSYEAATKNRKSVLNALDTPLDAPSES